MPFNLPPIDYATVALRAGDVEGVMAELLHPLKRLPAVVDAEQVWRDLITRQSAGSVALDSLVAVPHARTSGVRRIVLAGGRHPSGIPFDVEHRTVRLVFLILTPKERAADYLHVLAALAGRLRQQETRDNLLHTGSAEEFARLLGDRAAA